jgi:hypothetical protein
MIETLVRDLDKEIEYAATVSPLYDTIFRTIRDVIVNGSVLSDGTRTTLSDDIVRIWDSRHTTAWFERPLLLAAALHRLVLNGEYEELRPFYATCGGSFRQTDSPKLRTQILGLLQGEERAKFIAMLQQQTLQTNEISRGISWLLVLSSRWMVRRTGIALFEIGTSAGLNLLADQYGWEIQADGNLVSLPGEPIVRMELINETKLPYEPVLAAASDIGNSVSVRIGCDLNVPDVRKPSDREMLEAMIWGDNPIRLDRLRRAIRRQEDFLNGSRVQLSTGDAIEMVHGVSEEIARRMESGDLVCFFNTIVTCYFNDESYLRLRSEIAKAFSGPLKAQRCLWIEHEPKRPMEMISSTEARFDSLVRVSELDHNHELQTRIVAGTEMHPSKFVWLDPD